jgi:chemotaxis protein methyltransferase CheR
VEKRKLLEEIARLVYENCGIVFKDSNLSVLESRISVKLREKKTTAENYYNILKTDKEELSSFIDFVTTNFTSFFRSENQFHIMEEFVLPEIVKQTRNEKIIKLWSAGCATGEEPYSMAMVVDDFLDKNGLYKNGWDFFVVASDISLQSLFVAREGKFPESSVKKVPKPFVEKYFNFIDDRYIVKDALKKKVRFDFHNLIYDNGIRNIDITFCRNVLIYFDEKTQKQVLENIYIASNEKSYLFLGHSESLFGIYDKFKPVSHPKGIVYVKSV